MTETGSEEGGRDAALELPSDSGLEAKAARYGLRVLLILELAVGGTRACVGGVARWGTRQHLCLQWWSIYVVEPQFVY